METRIWTPLKSPPNPKNVSCLSEGAQKIIASLLFNKSGAVGEFENRYISKPKKKKGQRIEDPEECLILGSPVKLRAPSVTTVLSDPEYEGGTFSFDRQKPEREKVFDFIDGNESLKDYESYIFTGVENRSSPTQQNEMNVSVDLFECSGQHFEEIKGNTERLNRSMQFVMKQETQPFQMSSRVREAPIEIPKRKKRKPKDKENKITKYFKQKKDKDLGEKREDTSITEELKTKARDAMKFRVSESLARFKKPLEFSARDQDRNINLSKEKKSSVEINPPNKLPCAVENRKEILQPRTDVNRAPGSDKVKIRQPRPETESNIAQSVIPEPTKPTYPYPKKSFQPPINNYFKAPVSAGSNLCYKIITITDDNIASTEGRILAEDILEIGFTICYREGFCLLDKPLKKGSRTVDGTCHPSGLLARIVMANNTVDVLNFVLVQNTIPPPHRKMLLSLLGRVCRKICFEAQSFILFLIDLIQPSDKRVCYDWLLVDPGVGWWLLDPDQPLPAFNVLAASTLPEEVNNIKGDTISRWCALLESQSSATETFYHALVKNSLWDIFLHMETKVIPIVAVMESWSIKIDRPKLVDMGNTLSSKLKTIEAEAWKAAGHKFQLNSTVELRKTLYEELHLDEKASTLVKRTPATQSKSTDESTLRGLSSIHPLPLLVLEYRHLQKLQSTYIDGFLIHLSKDDTLSTTWDLCSAATGRLTSSSPNVQSVPKNPVQINDRQKIELRECFVARDGCRLLGVDFQHIELRIFAHFSGDRQLISAFQSQGDVFVTLSQKRLGHEDVSSEERNRTKVLVYALMYGAGLGKLAQVIGEDIENTKEVVQQLLCVFPSLREFTKTVVEECRCNGRLRSLAGRIRLFPNITSSDQKARAYAERQALNFLIQGSAADICKMAMVSCEAELKGIPVKLLMQIHDELIWEAPTNLVPQVLNIIEKTLEGNSAYWGKTMGFRVPLSVKVTSGPNWAHMK